MPVETTKSFFTVLVAASSLVLLSSCGGGTYVQPALPSTPQFASVDQSFRWYNAHMKGDRFELLDDGSGNLFVMEYDFRGTSMALPFQFVPVQEQFGMMLDSKLCTNGLAVLRGANATTYLVNIKPGIETNVRLPVPIGVCFTRI